VIKKFILNYLVTGSLISLQKSKLCLKVALKFLSTLVTKTLFATGEVVRLGPMPSPGQVNKSLTMLNIRSGSSVDSLLVSLRHIRTSSSFVFTMLATWFPWINQMLP
jgi:hypothetical protein